MDAHSWPCASCVVVGDKFGLKVGVPLLSRISNLSFKFNFLQLFHRSFQMVIIIKFSCVVSIIFMFFNALSFAQSAICVTFAVGIKLRKVAELIRDFTVLCISCRLVSIRISNFLPFTVSLYWT